MNKVYVLHCRSLMHITSFHRQIEKTSSASDNLYDSVSRIQMKVYPTT